MKTKTNRTLRKILSIALCLALIMSYVPMVSVRTGAAISDLTVTIDTGASVTLKDTDGDDYYEIGTADELYAFAAGVNAGNSAINGELTANIVVNENVLNADGSLNKTPARVWNCIGYKNSDSDYIDYTGLFNGNNFYVSGLYYNDSVGYAGFFGRLGENAKIEKLTLKDSYFYGKECMGGIAGYAKGTVSIVDCCNSATVKSVEEAGGILGYSAVTNLTIDDCENTGAISSENDYAGGILGFSGGANLTINDCENTGAISSIDDYIGGIVGYVGTTMVITNCHNSGSFKGDGYIGGIVGYMNNGTIENCYNTYSASSKIGSNYIGGICGRQDNGLINKCYNTGNLVTSSVVGGIVGQGKGGTVSNCYNTGNISSSGFGVAGICGIGKYIKNCYSTGNISGNTQDIGGVVGSVYSGSVTNCFYITGCATDYASVVQYGIGNSKKDTQTPDVEGCTTGVSIEQVASGELAYLLDQSNTVQIWGQDIDDNKPVQAYPNFTGYKVYRDAADGYTNLLPLTENAEGYYEIDSFCDLVWFSNNINNGNIPRNTNAILTADIDMQGVSWTPICSTGLYYNTTEYTDKGYEGIFDGNGFVIKNLALKGTNGVNCTVGLFGTLSGTVKNLGMDGVTFDLNGATDVRAAGIAGQMLDGSLIENCYVVNSNLTPGLYIVGGVAGCNYAGTIRNCFTKNVTISANERCGNLVSDCRGDIAETDRIGTVENCWTDAGRVVGTQSVAEYIIDCHTASGDMFEKGMVAYNLGDAWGQNLNNGEDNQGHPVINGAKVYFNGYNGCPEYSNSESTIEHNFVNGICSGCSLYEAAVVVSESNYEDLELSADYVGYYAVANAGQLLWYSKNHGDIVNLVLVEDFEIGKDIKWMPLSNSVKIFDGAGHTITIEQDHADTEISSNYGLFSELNVGTIKNVILNGSIKIKTSGNVGALSGSMYESAIENVISYVDITNLGTGNTGGLSGYYGGRDPSVINNCAVYADISSGGNAGGIIGSGWGGTRFYRIYNTAVVGTVSGTTAGALVGYSATGNSGGSFYPSSVRFENIYYNVGDSDILTVGAWATNGGVSCETMAKFVSVEAKTAEQFASGEVAYLLQQGNTEQVWGQMSNTEGSLPMLSDNELYKVATVAETGNYSVANIGDTTNDGIVDVNDYQALINTILADDHEQIEAASYDDIIRYDLDGDGYLDVIDASLMHNFINGFITVDVYAVGDYDCNGKAFEEIDLKTIKHAIEKSTKLSTTEKYLCDINKDGKFDPLDISFLEETYGEIENISCEDNLKTTYSWANDYSTCTATAKCSLCGKIIAVETVNTEYYYEESEWEIYTSYTARFENEFFEEKNVEFWEYKNNDETTTDFIGGDDGFLDW